LLVATLSLFLTACYNIERSETNVNTTFGQELIDLKKALDSGAIDQQQYQKILSQLADRRLNIDLSSNND